MNATTLIILIAIGLFAGVFSGFVGLGGGIIIIPALVFILGMDQFQAQGTSLAVMLPPIGLLAAYNYYRAGYVDVRYAIIIALAFLIGGYFGSRLALNIPVVLVKKIFGLALAGMALHLIFSKY